MTAAPPHPAERVPHFLGTAATEDGAGVDYAALRASRRRRVLEAMADAGIDALVLGRYPNIKYVTGHRSLWRAVLTPTAPVCVLVRSTGQVWLQASTWDDGIPPEVPHANLTGLTWNPRTVVGALQGVDGLAGARKVAADGVAPSGTVLLSLLCPDAEVLDAQPLLDAVRRVRTDVEVHCIRTALAMAEGAVVDVGRHAVAGADEQALKGRAAKALVRFGPVILASEPVVRATPTERGPRSSPDTPPLALRPSARPLSAGDLVATRVEVLHTGYLGSVARTWVVGPGGGVVPDGADDAGSGAQALWARWRRAAGAVVAACRPGATPDTLLAAWDGSGEPRPGLPVVVGVGHGVEPPVVGGTFATTDGDDTALEVGMTLCVQGYVWEPGVGGYLASETVRVTNQGPELLTRLPGGLVEPA